MTFTLPESLWLYEHGFDDLLLGVPHRTPRGARRSRAGWRTSARRSSWSTPSRTWT